MRTTDLAGGLLALLALLTIPACGVLVNLEAERKALLDADRAWAAAVEHGDREKVESYWADDAVIYFAGHGPVIGKPAILEFVKEQRAKPGFSILWGPAEAVVSRAADLGYTLGAYEVTMPTAGGPVTMKGTYLSVWRHQADGTWICTLEIHSPGVTGSSTR